MLVSCLPPRPQVDFCRIDFILPGCHCTNGKDRNYILSADDCGNHIAFSARDIEAVEGYAVSLEKLVLELKKKKTK